MTVENPHERPCLSDEEINLLTQGLLMSPSLESVEGHLDVCVPCSQLVADLLRATHSAEVAVPYVGTVIGRYIVLGKLGSGAMGEVYTAHDPQLDRKIAIKLLKANHFLTASREELRQRLMREAQALARLQHPHVVSVFDTGVWSGQIFLGMEYVPGSSARSWQTQKSTSWKSIVSVYLKAGMGLAAAHRAGLVHRDFKPDNILVAGDEVKVTDFGLAAFVHGPSVENGVTTESITSMDASLTRSGAIPGTPAYMAPAQLEGAPADALSDQFSFCVCLYEALYGRRPFAGTTFVQLLDEMKEGFPTSHSPGRKIPSWLKSILRRGLSPEAKGRFSSMEELLQNIHRGLSRDGKRRWGIAAVLLGTTVALAIGKPWEDNARCLSSMSQMGNYWSPEQRQALQKAFVGTGVPHAATVWHRFSEELDRYTNAWTRLHEDVCRLPTSQDAFWDTVTEARVECLGDKAQDVKALLSALTKVDAKALDKALPAAYRLPDVRKCADVSTWGDDRLSADDVRKKDALKVRNQLSEMRVKVALGQHDAALEQARTLEEKVEQVGYLPLKAEFSFEMGAAQTEAGNYQQALSSFELAGLLAVKSRADYLAATSWTELVYVTGYHLKLSSDAERWARQADAMVERLGGDSVLEERLASVRGTSHVARAEFKEAEHEFRKGADLIRGRLGEKNILYAKALSNVGSALRSRGMHVEALDVMVKASQINRELLGDAHPTTATMINNIGAILGSMKRFPEAIVQFNESLKLREAALGADHPLLATNHLNLGEAYLLSRDNTAALNHFRHSARIAEKTFGSQHPSVAEALEGQGLALVALNRYAEAQQQLERALRIFDLFPEGDPELRASTAFALARAVAPRDIRRSRRLANEALSTLKKIDTESARNEMVEVERWLAR